MHRIVHLSDVHLLAHPASQPTLFRSLFAALDHVRQQPRGNRPGGVDLLAITGDLFQSADLASELELDVFHAWFGDLTSMLPQVPVVILPGNHDVRSSGVIAPHQTALFDALRRTLAARHDVLVHGDELPFLATRVDPTWHGLPIELVLFDSTWLPTGRVSAGGMFRQPDLLAMAAELDPRPLPLLFLLHHHLVPTPLTDVSTIDVSGQPWSVRWLVRHALPWLVANGDREELSMTALGAGTALTTLHTLGRAVIVVHGHKHYPTVRLISGVHAAHGDVLVSSAGSAGLAEPWRPGPRSESISLWPSFNVIELDAESVRIDAVSYSDTQLVAPVVRPLIDAVRRDAQWQLTTRPSDRTPLGSGPRLALNHAHYVLRNASHSLRLWDAHVTRILRSAANHPRPGRYRETIAGAPGASLNGITCAGDARPDQPCTVPLDLPIDGETHYDVIGGWEGNWQQAVAHGGLRSEPFEWVGLINRYASDKAELVLDGLPEAVGRPFGSAVDLTTGLERPVALHCDAGSYRIEMIDCPPRTLLRIFWRLSR